MYDPGEALIGKQRSLIGILHVAGRKGGMDSLNKETQVGWFPHKTVNEWKGAARCRSTITKVENCQDTHAINAGLTKDGGRE
jgi:hypothetical protein